MPHARASPSGATHDLLAEAKRVIRRPTNRPPHRSFESFSSNAFYKLEFLGLKNAVKHVILRNIYLLNKAGLFLQNHPFLLKEYQKESNMALRTIPDQDTLREMQNMQSVSSKKNVTVDDMYESYDLIK